MERILLKEAVGKRLKECRLQAGLTQKQVADKLGVAQPVYQRFEKGLYECGYEHLAALCRTLYSAALTETAPGAYELRV